MIKLKILNPDIKLLFHKFCFISKYINEFQVEKLTLASNYDILTFWIFLFKRFIIQNNFVSKTWINFYLKLSNLIILPLFFIFQVKNRKVKRKPNLWTIINAFKIFSLFCNCGYFRLNPKFNVPNKRRIKEIVFFIFELLSAYEQFKFIRFELFFSHHIISKPIDPHKLQMNILPSRDFI